jgi:hypothetical protein
MPVGRAAILSAEIDTVVTDERGSFAFSSFLIDKTTPLPPHWLIVHEPSGAWEAPPALEGKYVRTAHEVHLFPGMPLLVQCPALADAKDMGFHCSPLYEWRINDTEVFVSSDNGLFSFEHLQLPFALRQEELCPCGLRVARKQGVVLLSTPD